MANIEKLTKKARELLDKDEEIIVSVAGSYETTLAGNETLREAVFLATNKRLFLYAKRTFGYESEVFPYSNVSSIDFGKSILGRNITVFASGNKARIKWVQQGDVNRFVEYVRSRIGKVETSAQQVPMATDVLLQIKQLAALKEQGIVSEDEFQEKKKELLARI